MEVKIISSNVRREFETAINLFISGKKVEDIKYQVKSRFVKTVSELKWMTVINVHIKQRNKMTDIDYFDN